MITSVNCPTEFCRIKDVKSFDASFHHIQQQLKEHKALPNKSPSLIYNWSPFVVSSFFIIFINKPVENPLLMPKEGSEREACKRSSSMKTNESEVAFAGAAEKSEWKKEA